MRTITTELVSPTEDEYAELGMHVRVADRRFSNLYPLVGIAIMVIGFIRPSALWTEVGFAILLVGAWYWLYLRWFFRRTYRDPRYAILRTPTRAFVTAEQLSFEATDGVSSVIPWSQITKVERYKGDYLLYLAPVAAIRMFRRAQTAEDWEQFTEWAEKRSAEIDQTRRRAN